MPNKSFLKTFFFCSQSIYAYKVHTLMETDTDAYSGFCFFSYRKSTQISFLSREEQLYTYICIYLLVVKDFSNTILYTYYIYNIHIQYTYIIIYTIIYLIYNTCKSVPKDFLLIHKNCSIHIICSNCISE